MKQIRYPHTIADEKEQWYADFLLQMYEELYNDICCVSIGFYLSYDL